MSFPARIVFVIILAFAALAATPARADKKVIFSPLADGPDFDEAMAFFSGYLKPRDYDTTRSLKGTGGGWKLGNTLDLYLREFVRVGKGDIDDDGIDERFYIFEDPSWCGSKGCLILIVQKQPSGWKVICEDSGDTRGVGITDWMSMSGYRELKIGFRVYWHGGKCYNDDPEILNAYGPEHHPRPPAERIWKPIQ